MCKRLFSLCCYLVAIVLLPGILTACQKVELPSEEELREESKEENLGTEEKPATNQESENGTEDREEEDFPFEDEYIDFPFFNVNEFIAQAELYENELCIVQGYVVGFTTHTMKNAVFSAVGAVRTNILIASDPNQTDPAYCVPVELGDEGYRKALSLADNPELLGRKIAIMGILQTYFYVPGIRDIQMYKWADDETEDEPQVPDESDGTSETEDVEFSEETEMDQSRTDTLMLDHSGEIVIGGRVANHKK